MAFRDPTEDERRLLRCLAAAAFGAGWRIDWVDHVRVEAMNDGGMGSLRLQVSPKVTGDRVVHSVGAEVCFQDADGVDVMATLYVDDCSEPRELDIWKVNYEPLIRIPDTLPRATRPDSST